MEFRLVEVIGIVIGVFIGCALALRSLLKDI